MPDITMPRLSDTMEEGTIARWLKSPGDAVKAGEILAEIETDKATMDLEAYDAGVLEKILVPEGETVPIGQPIAVVGTGQNVQQQAQPTEPTDAAPPSSDQTQEAPPDQVPDGSIQKAETDQQPQKEGAETEQHPQPTQKEGAELDQTEERSDGRTAKTIKASPLARHLAEEYSIDLGQIQGSGPSGRIVRDDIEDYREQHQQQAATAPTATGATPPQQAPAPTPAAQVSSAQEAEVIPLTRVQTIIARRLTESKQTIPHFYVSNEVDMTDVLVVRQQLNANVGEGGVKISVNDLIVKAAALALEKFPEVNSSFKESQFVRHSHINVGIAVDVPSGLVVPVIRDANLKGVRTIAREAKALIEKSHTNKLAPTNFEGGTFTVSNLGMMDVTEFIAVINPPEAAILAIASTRKHFVPINDQPVVRDLMTMTLSADHRVVYGATVARFLQEVKQLLQNPYNLLG